MFRDHKAAAGEICICTYTNIQFQIQKCSSLVSEKNAKLYWIDQQPDLNTSFVQISDTEDIEIKGENTFCLVILRHFHNKIYADES